MPRRQVPPKKREGFVVGIKDHLLAFPGIGDNEKHPAVTETEVRNIDDLDHAGKDDFLVAPVELVGLTRSERQRDEDLLG